MLALWKWIFEIIILSGFSSPDFGQEFGRQNTSLQPFISFEPSNLKFFYNRFFNWNSDTSRQKELLYPGSERRRERLTCVERAVYACCMLCRMTDMCRQKASSSSGLYVFPCMCVYVSLSVSSLLVIWQHPDYRHYVRKKTMPRKLEIAIIIFQQCIQADHQSLFFEQQQEDSGLKQ